MPARTAALKSSWLSSATYDEETQTLTVVTQKGTKHQHQVPPEVFNELVTAPSPGKYYGLKLRNK
jgi:hypothetical protein